MSYALWILLGALILFVLILFALNQYIKKYERSTEYWAKQYFYHVHWFFTAEKWGLKRGFPEVITSTFMGDVDWRLKEGLTLGPTLLKQVHQAFLIFIDEYKDSDCYGYLPEVRDAMEGLYRSYLSLFRIPKMEIYEERIKVAEKYALVHLMHYKYCLIDSFRLRYAPNIPFYPADPKILPSRTCVHMMKECYRRRFSQTT